MKYAIVVVLGLVAASVSACAGFDGAGKVHDPVVTQLRSGGGDTVMGGGGEKVYSLNGK